MNTDRFTLSKTYQFKETEQRIYTLWEKNGFLKPANDPNHPGHDPSVKPYVIAIPPPNVTGELHLGHAMFVAMEDLMIRHQRMKGVPTLWIPGTDHAGIATQLQVEKLLLRTEEVTREEIGREKFLEHTWAWKEKYGGIINDQVRRLGASCDWSRLRFTLDDGLSRAVREAFVRLYEKGLIYRGPRLINWSPGLKTAVSDLEVEYHEEQGRLYYFKYVIEGAEAFIPVATTRPETILGDTAVAVHPDDERFRHLVGRQALVPILGRKVPVIADDAVDMEFGTGALKITPGHDPNDYQIGARHGLDTISMLDQDARVTDAGGPYAGLDRFEARKRLWEDMRAAGLVIKEEPYTHMVPRSQRGGEIIEPMISTQWFVEIKHLAEPAIEAVRDGRITIVPDYFAKVYYNWMENIQDWCISRQLWWGHRIPIWYCPDGHMTTGRTDPEVCGTCGSAELEQDPDVLDTWFSSGLWPFSTLGWPDETPDLKYFYPTTMMETGYDILFFWVARMIMMGLEFTGEAPFETVYLHGLIRDEQGRKMSKTTGNVIDPLIVMDEFGTDALRFTLLVGSTPGKDMNLSLEKVEANRNFANKLWNAGRFILGALRDVPSAAEAPPAYTTADAWIWARQKELRGTVAGLFRNHLYGEAGRQIYEFFWSEFADWYLEIAKLQLREGGDRAFYTADVLVSVLDTSLRMLHPYTPYITEELWGYLKQAASAASPKIGLEDTQNGGWPEALIVAPWPEPQEPEGWEDWAIGDFKNIQEIVRAIRNQRSEKNLKPSARIGAVIAAGETALERMRKDAGVICALAGLSPENLTLANETGSKPDGHIALVAGEVEIYLPLADLANPSEERFRLKKELAETEAQIDRLETLLSGPFAEKAPAPIVAAEREKLAAYRAAAAKLEGQVGG
ncbi:MAG TPA: valine--tRNA ligase [Anaerolineales bacterium]|nr:valine--tRNA ligase [Anaerolineales bacterium]